MKKWRIIPRVSYTNFRKEYGKNAETAFRSWFSVRRYWGGRLINVSIRHHVVSFDFRRSWLNDLVEDERSDDGWGLSRGAKR